MSELLPNPGNKVIDYDHTGNLTGFILRQVRINLGLSIKKTSELGSVSVPAIQKFETGGTQTSVSTLFQHCSVLGIKPHQVLQVVGDIIALDNVHEIMKERRPGQVPVEICREISKRLGDIIGNTK